MKPDPATWRDFTFVAAVTLSMLSVIMLTGCGPSETVSGGVHYGGW